MHVEQKRIFIGNLPGNIKETDLKELFAHYGSVVSVDLKQRKDSGSQSTNSVFAFVNIEINNKKLNQCFQELPRTEKWKGNQIKLELAKESFLERLKREREEAQNKLNKNNEYVKSTNTEISFKPHSVANNKKIYHSSDSDDSDVESNNTDTKNDADEARNESVEPEEPFIIKNNKNKTNFNNKTESINVPVHVTKKSKGNELKDKKSLEADDKRRKSLQRMKSTYQNQKNAIKLALSSMDTTSRNKIIFNDEIIKSNKKRDTEGPSSSANEHFKKKRLELFEEEVEEDGINFEIKTQFEGKSGQKLLELQSRFQNDKRFTLDSRFMEEEGDEEKEETELPQVNEKEEQLNILESVIGQKIKKPKRIESHDNVYKQDLIVRYDPTNPEHSKYEIKQNQNESKTTAKEKKSKDKLKREENEKVEENKEVSQEKFYKVTEDLKKSLEHKENFSLLSLFGKAEEKDEKLTNEEAKDLKTPKYLDDNNPFRYDSSDTEDESATAAKSRIEDKSVNSQTSWIETFFFKENDERLKEGLKFLEKVFEPKLQSFDETRQRLKQVIHAKVRNRLRNNRPFQRKVGRSNAFRYKRAMRN